MQQFGSISQNIQGKKKKSDKKEFTLFTFILSPMMWCFMKHFLACAGVIRAAEVQKEK